MKAKILLFGLLSLVFLVDVRHSYGKTSDFVVQNADDMNTLSVAGSSQLSTLIANVETRVLAQYANAMKSYDVVAIPGELDGLLEQVSERFVLQYANANRFRVMVYPVDLIGDTEAPRVDDLTVTPIGTGGVAITWTTDEYATSTFEYGMNPGTYAETIIDEWYHKDHEVTLTGLTLGGIFYYRISSSDRSGNTRQLADSSFTIVSPLYLPMILQG